MLINCLIDVGIVYFKGMEKVLVMIVDCNFCYVNVDLEIGIVIVIFEVVCNIVVLGGIFFVIINCLNFGNLYNLEFYWQFVGVIKGMLKVCLKFEILVMGGNVFFYN